jgi:flagellar biogenesis protein FliO
MERAMHNMAGWDWIWMTFVMGFWIALIGAVVYIAVRLAQRPPTKSI